MTAGEFVPGRMPAQLREYWVHGKGAAKIKWGVPHDFDRCVRHLRKYFPTNPQGLCNILHREALGVAPGQEHALDTDMADCEFCLSPRHPGPCAEAGTGLDRRSTAQQQVSDLVQQLRTEKDPRKRAVLLRQWTTARRKLSDQLKRGTGKNRTSRSVRVADQYAEDTDMADFDFHADYTADTLDFHADCVEGEFCLAPLHKGPCKGFRHGLGVDKPNLPGGRRHRDTNVIVTKSDAGKERHRLEAVKEKADVDVAKPKVRPKRQTPQERAKMLKTATRMYVKGASLQEVAQELGVSSTKIHRMLVNAGVQLRARGGRKKKFSTEAEEAAYMAEVEAAFAAADDDGAEFADDDDMGREKCPEGQHMMPNGECMDDDDSEMFMMRPGAPYMARKASQKPRKARQPSTYAQMSSADINDLPDSAFAYIEPGGTKDKDGKTVPRSLRHFPIHDEAHVRNALARASQSPFGDKALPKIRKAAKAMGIGDYNIDLDDDDDAMFAMVPTTEGWRGVIAPIGKPTGDGRRFAQGALSHQDLPLPWRFQRQSGDGHVGAVTVGRITKLDIGDDQVYAEGDWLNPDIVPEVAEAKELMRAGVLGASVDLDEFKFEARHRESGELFSPEKHCHEGSCEAQEALVTNGRIRAATGVAIPAFAEASKLELYTIVDEQAVLAAFAADGFEFTDEDCGCDDETETPTTVVASTTVSELPGPAVFARQESELVGFAARGEQLFGYVADKRTCHTEIKGTCTRPPLEEDYSLFHRYLVAAATDSGVIPVGRFTVGYGKFVGKCGCCNADDHACQYADLAGTIAHYDLLDRVIDARVGVDDRGIWWAGTWAAGATPEAKKIIQSRGMSGDWRMFDGRLRLVEVMGVSVTRPAFPISAMRDGRQLSLVAAAPQPTVVDPKAELSAMVNTAVAAAVRADRRRLEAAWLIHGLDQHQEAFRRSERERLLTQLELAEK